MTIRIARSLALPGAVLASLVLFSSACTPAEPPPHPPGPSTVPPNRPTTSQGLGQATFNALHANDPQAMVDLVVTVFDFGRACPKLNPSFLKRRDQLLADTRARFAECQAMIDWSGATVSGITGGEPGKPSTTCADSKPLQPIVVSVRSGEKVLEVKLEDPVAIDGAVVISEPGPRCKLVDNPS